MTDYRLAWLNFLYWQNRHTLKKKKERWGGRRGGNSSDLVWLYINPPNIFFKIVFQYINIACWSPNGWHNRSSTLAQRMKANQQVTANKIVKRTALNKDTHSYSNSDSSRTERPQRTLGNSHSQGHSWSHEPCWLRDKTPLGLVQWTRDFFSLSFFNSPSASLLMSASLCQAQILMVWRGGSVLLFKKKK